MKKISLTFFELGSLLWILTATFLLIIALLGIFHAWLGLAFFALLVACSIWLVKREHLNIQKHSKKEFTILSFLVGLGIVLALNTTPTIFGGRDEGSFSNAAILLAQNHELTTSSELIREFFGIYGPGKALNFPGFNYTQTGELESQFLSGYTAWIAFWYELFGISGIKFVNLLPFVTLLFSFYLICKRFINKKNYDLAGLLLLAASVPTIVFFKFTLTEIFFASLIWLSLHFLLEYLENKNFFRFILLFIPLLIIPFIRIESIGIIFALIFLLIAFDFKNLRETRYQSLCLLIGIIFALAVLTNTHFFVDSFKSFFELSGTGNATPVDSETLSFLPDDWSTLFLPRVLFAYNILPIFLLGFAAIIFLLKKKNWKLLIPFFFFASTLVYIVDANISLDHPWMLRRLTFSIIPLMILYSVFLLSAVANKFPKFASFFVILLLLSFGLLSASFILYSQNKNLLTQAKQITETVGKNDLLLIGRQASGSGWSLLSEPLRNISDLNAVYFFNPDDLAKIERSKFSSIYLLISKSEEDLFFEIPKKEVSNYTLKNSIIAIEKDPTKKPSTENYSVSGSLYKLD